ncbi:hypothetical protein [Rudaea sp.]|uniref:hypothetical protein n=1 Tax=Rudaea sp. TaxID=2136325 RepID=UPI002ED1F8CA
MSDDVEARIRWLAQFCCQPSWAAAVTCACERVEQLDPEQGAPLLQQINDTGPSVADRNNVLFDNAERMRSRDPMLTLAFEILTLCTDDDATVINAVVAGAVSVVSSTDGDTREARARLRVWDAAATGKYTGNDFFEIANISWQGEMQRNVADQEDQSRASSGIPTCVAILAHDRWDHAMAWLRRETERQVVHQLDLEILQPRGDRNQQAAQIRAFAERLFAQGRPWTGDLAIAWLAMLCDPRRPDTFTAVLPQISWMFGHQSVITNPHERGLLRDRLGIWWRAACSEWTDSDVSIFRIAAMEMQDRDYEPEAEGDSTLDPPPVAPAATDTPTVVVMPGKLADERGLPMPWKDLRDQALQLVVCNDAAIVREVARGVSTRVARGRPADAGSARRPAGAHAADAVAWSSGLGKVAPGATAR